MEEKRIPFVIDNRQHSMRDILCQLLKQHSGRSLDIATAYFTVSGWQLISSELSQIGTLRLLLGDQPEQSTDIGMREIGASPIKGLIRDLEETPYNPGNLNQIEELIDFLSHDQVKVRLATSGFLHAKAYLFYGNRNFLRLSPHIAIVGSANFTRPGLLSNHELNLVHRADLTHDEAEPDRIGSVLPVDERVILDELDERPRTLAANIPGLIALQELTQWYSAQWSEARDFKDELIELINASKFGRKEYTPYQVYTKIIYEYFRAELKESDPSTLTRSAVELSEFQEDAVKKARKILERYSGVLIADSVGLGKTWIGKKLLEDYAYHLRNKAIVICPAALQKTWQQELFNSGIPATVITQESLGRENIDGRNWQDADVILIDESHNFRNSSAQRYNNLERQLAANQRLGGVSGERKKVILLTATPINNDLLDLYNQVSLITGGDRSYFAHAGIGDLQRYFLDARRAEQTRDSTFALFNFLEEIVIRRTRPFIKQTYPDATIKGIPIHWPERRLKTIRYNLEATYKGIYSRLVSRIEQLNLAPYHLESYKLRGIARDQFEEGRGDALVGIFKSRYLKRFESCIDAFRISIRRALEFLSTFESYLQQGRVLDSSNFQKALRFLASEDEEDDVTIPPTSQASLFAEQYEMTVFLEALPPLDPQHYDQERLQRDIQQDIAALRAIWLDIQIITPEQDAKLIRLKELLATDLRGQKVLIFTYYRDTARYLYRHLCGVGAEAAAWLQSAGSPHIRFMDSGKDARERAKLIAAFAPRANQQPELARTPEEIDIMISTDVLSEGQNLQDCGLLINYDLHWNPTRMIQRAGRIDRIGTTYDTLWIYNMFPDDGLEHLLGLVASLTQKLTTINRSGLLDASVLGEVVQPQNFNTLHRIEAEDSEVVEEQEQFAELASSETLLQHLKDLLNRGMRQELDALPHGIHSGMQREGARGVFFYFVAPSKDSPEQPDERQHFWRYIDLSSGAPRVEENRFLISRLLHCQPDTPRCEPFELEMSVFELQEMAISSIITSVHQQIVVEALPKVLDPIQKKLLTILRRALQTAHARQHDLKGALSRLEAPQPRVHLKALKRALSRYEKDQQFPPLHEAIMGIDLPVEPAENEPSPEPGILQRHDLTLICFEYIW